MNRRLTAQQVARYYGFNPNRAGFIQCPFHQGDRTPSLKLYPEHRGWCCFGCRKGGSVVNFVMELFGLSFPQAIIRLDSDFHLGLTNQRPTPGQRAKIADQRRREEAERARLEGEYRALAEEHRYWHEIVKHFAPTRAEWEGGWAHPFYAEGVKRLPELEWRLDQLEEKFERERG